MKKLITLMLCFTLGTALLTGCGDKPMFEQKSYIADGTQITTVNIDVIDREIEVSRSNDNQIHIDYFESDKEYYDISVSNEKELSMTAANNKEWTDYVGGKTDDKNRKILLQVPDSLLTTLTLSTTNERISLPALTVTDSISLSVNGGNITFEKISVGNKINLTAKNGDITGSILGSYEDYAIVCKGKKGESNLPSNKEGGTKSLEVSNNNGDIKIDFVKE